MLPEYPHRIHVDEIDILVESDAAPLPLPDGEPTDADRQIAVNCAAFIPDGATLQTGIGAVPSTIAKLLAESENGNYGIHSEMFTTGLMHLHKAGKVTNEKGQFDGVSIATFAAGTEDLYEWLDGNEDVVFLPVEIVNSPAYIRANRRMVTINAAIAVDIHGQVVADTIGGRQYSGIGGHEDFVTGPALELEDRSLLCLPSTAEVDGKTISRVVPAFEAGTVSHDPAPSGRRRRHRVRRRRASGQDDPRPRDGARQDRPPRLPRRADGRRRTGVRRPLANRLNLTWRYFCLPAEATLLGSRNGPSSNGRNGKGQ